MGKIKNVPNHQPELGCKFSRVRRPTKIVDAWRP
jgi:hypothetical protein